MSIILSDDFVYPQAIEDVGNHSKKLTFPDGFSCYAQSQISEAVLFYNEIIAQQDYFQHGLSIAEARCVVDVGANIGIFTMAVKLKAPDAIVYAFEPIPDTFQILEQNIHSLGCSDIHMYNAAVGSRDHSEQTFIFFPNMSGNSTSVPALKDKSKPIMDQIFGRELSDFLHQSETRTVPVRTLSSVIREQGIANIDYLKIDVEGGEISVLAGIDEIDWPIIQQIVAEAHNAQLREQVSETLVQHGFEVFFDHGLLGKSSPSEVTLVYGKRKK